MKRTFDRLKFRVELFLIGFPYGLLGKVIMVEEYGKGSYTIWDRIRYRLYMGESLTGGQPPPQREGETL